MNTKRSSRGAALIWMAVTFPLLLIFAGLVCDTAMVNVTRSHLQTAADAAALAGARLIPVDSDLVKDKASAIAFANTVLNQKMVLAPSDIILGRYTRPPKANVGFVAGATPYNAVKVIARKTSGSPMGNLPLIFGPIVGVQYSDVSAEAIAMTDFTPAGVIVLDPTGSGALSMNGTPDFIVTGGSINVNSSHARAVNIVGSGTMIADSLDIVGNYRATGNSTLPNQINLNVKPPADPFASLPAPAQPGNGGLSSNIFSPGYYPQGINLSGNGKYTLLPGTYYIDNGISITGNVELSGEGVLFYLKSGGFKLAGTGALSLTPQTSGTYAGITFFQARGNSSASNIVGTADLNIEGAIYIPDGPLDLRGTSDSFANALVVKDLSIGGNGKITIPLIPLPSGGPPYLVK